MAEYRLADEIEFLYEVERRLLEAERRLTGLMGWEAVAADPLRRVLSSSDSAAIISACIDAMWIHRACIMRNIDLLNRVRED